MLSNPNAVSQILADESSRLHQSLTLVSGNA